MTERTFLQKLADDQQARRTPVVDEAFIKTFSQLSWEDQCIAMNHIYFLKSSPNNFVGDHQGVVHRARLHKLYETWLEDQTETWVGIYYRPPIETAYWNGERPKDLPHVQGEPYDEEKALALARGEEDPFDPSTWKARIEQEEQKQKEGALRV